MPQDPQTHLFDIIEQSTVLLFILPIQDQQQHQVKPKGYVSAVVVHFFLKAVVLALLGLSQLVVIFFEEKITAQLIMLFIVFQFWFTKNVTGKRMLGYWWYFGQDQHGQQRLFFQCRANPEYMDSIKPKLFWIIQFASCVISILYILQAFFLIPNTGVVDFRKIELCALQLASGIGNIFFFLKISDSIAQRQQTLRTRLGMDGVRKLGLGSITSHY